MANYRETDKGQGLFLTVNLEEQILPGTFEWTMSQFMDTRVDYSGFDQSYNNDETGAPAIHPRIMLKIVLYGYSQGVYSSRKLQRLCQYHMIMKALAEDEEPFFNDESAVHREERGRDQEDIHGSAVFL
jgi:hypothetical protein